MLCKSAAVESSPLTACHAMLHKACCSACLFSAMPAPAAGQGALLHGVPNNDNGTSWQSAAWPLAALLAATGGLALLLQLLHR